MSLIIIFISLLTTITFLSKVLLVFSKKPKYPPSPPRLPIIGNLHQLGPLPHRSLHTLSKKHGPLMLLQLGQVPLLVASSPSMAKEIMKTQDHLFANRPSIKAATKLLYNGKDVAFAPYGEYWKQVRKFSVYHLLSPTMVSSYKTIREDEVVFMLEKIKKLCLDGDQMVNLSEELRSMAMDIITKVALGKRLRESGAWGGKLRRIIRESSRLLGALSVGDYLRGFAWVDSVSGLDGRLEKSFKEADELLDKIVEDEMRGTWREGESHKSFIHILFSLIDKDQRKEFAFSKENIKAVIKDVIGAGTESVYLVMEWAMAELLKNPNKLKTLKTDIRDVITASATTTPIIKEQDLKEMHYLRAVIKETLRLHPPGPLLVPRESMEDTQIGPYKIPKNTRVATNVWAIGRDPQVWEAPDEFRPERFLGSNCVDFKGCDFELIPFGAGRRICPAIQFSTSIIELTVANLVHLFDWNLGAGVEDLDMIEAPGLTASKRIDLVLNATPCF